MSTYMLLVRGGYESERDLSPEEMQQRIGKYSAWAGKLSAAGKLVDARKVTDEPRILTQENGAFVVQAPQLTENTIGGYFVIEAANQDEALAIAKECPTFEHGGSLEVREIET